MYFLFMKHCLETRGFQASPQASDELKEHNTTSTFINTSGRIKIVSKALLPSSAMTFSRDSSLTCSKRTAMVSPDQSKPNLPQHGRFAFSAGFGGPLYQQGPKENLPVRSQSIPIHNSTGMKRTPSELQLCQDEQVADYRDYMMFSRIYTGISEQMAKTNTSAHTRATNEQCLEHIIKTRNDAVLPSSSYSAIPTQASYAPTMIPEDLECDEEVFTMDL